MEHPGQRVDARRKSQSAHESPPTPAGWSRDDAQAACEAAAFVDRLRIFNRNVLPILVVHLLLAAVVALTQRDAFASRLSQAWLLAIVGMVVWRVCLYRRLAAERDWSADMAAAAARQFVLSSGLAGVLWGLTAPLFYYGGALDTRFLIVVILTGMGAGAVTSLIMYMPAFYAFLLPSLLPLAAVAFLYQDAAHLALGIATLGYALALSYFGGNFSRALAESLILRYENVGLVAELRRRTRAADQANAAKSRFVAAASHDLRQPVHALVLFADALRNCSLDPRAARITEQVGTAVGALDRMVNSLLDISQLESGKMTVEREALDLEPLLSELVGEFAPQARDKGLAMRVESTACRVLADRALLERILRNLIANAVCYTEEGEIVVRASRDDVQVRIEVADTGRGIAAADQERVFDAFSRLDNANHDPRKGLGLGLAIVKRAADMLDTRVEVESEAGTGAVFSLVLPSVAPLASARHRATTTPPVPAGDELQGMCVLVIDDDASIRRGMHTLLQDWGCVVTCCAGHDDAMQSVEQGFRPQAIIADLRLSGRHTGLDVIRVLRRRVGPALPAVIVTGDAQPAVSIVAGEAPVPILQKPAPPARIRSFLRSVRRSSLAVATAS